MKKKLQLSIDETVIRSSKFVALKNDTSISALVENFLIAIDKHPQLIELINNSATGSNNGSASSTSGSNKPSTKHRNK